MANRSEALPMPIVGRFSVAAIRDRLLTNPRFVSWAGAFPLTRFFARKRAAALFDLCAGFVYSQALFACVKVNAFEILKVEPLTAGTFAQKARLPIDGAIRLLQAADALKLVEKRGGDRYGLGALGAAVAANPGIAAMVEHHAHLYADLTDPVGLLSGAVTETALADYWPYAGVNRPDALGDAEVSDYSQLMSLSLPLVADEVLDGFRLNRHRCLLDVGGGEGVFVERAAARNPDLRLMLFDLPAVADRAKRRLTACGLGDRVAVTGGNFLSDPLPRGADIISLVRVILDHDDSSALCILKAVRAALPPDGVLLIAEPLAETDGAEAVGAYFTLYLKAMGRGRPRTFDQLCLLLEEAGFDRIRLKVGKHVLRTGIVTARPQGQVLS
ncbi:MAG: methyltransferase [Pseudomonadota bacterium]